MKYFLSVIFSLLIFGCSSQSTKDQLAMRDHVQNKNFEGALKVLENSDIKKNPSDEILYLMERGSISFYQQKYLEAAEFWQRALQKTNEKYTKLSQVATSTVVSDQMKDYLPKDYEISYLYYFQSLAFFLEYEKNQDRSFLLKARASVVAWDSYLQQLKIENEFKSLYFDDYYARFFAGLIHETVNERSDLEIALQLYKDAYQLFLLQAPTYIQFTNNNGEYVGDLLKKLQSKEKWREQLFELSQKNQSSENESLQQVRKIIASKIINISKKIRKNEVKKLQKQFGLEDKDITSSDAVILSHKGWINILEAKPIRLSFSAAAKNKSASQAVLTAIAQGGFLVFAAKVLGQTGGSSHSSTSVQVNWYGVGDVTETIADAASLEFQVPSVQSPNVQEKEEFNLIYTSEKSNIIEKKQNLNLIQSFDDILYQSVERQKAKDVFLKGTRFLTKQILAMLTSYSIYQSMVARDKNQEGLAKLSAMASYFGASAAIKYSEKADVRFWSLIPSKVQISTIEIPTKIEKLVIEKTDKTSREIELKNKSKNKKEYHLQIIPLF